MTPPNFANRTMWTGDNLDIMRGMNSECVDNLQLLCGACNSAKGAGSQEELKVKLKLQGIIE